MFSRGIPTCATCAPTFPLRKSIYRFAQKFSTVQIVLLAIVYLL